MLHDGSRLETGGETGEELQKSAPRSRNALSTEDRGKTVRMGGAQRRSSVGNTYHLKCPLCKRRQACSMRDLRRTGRLLTEGLPEKGSRMIKQAAQRAQRKLERKICCFYSSAQQFRGHTEL